MKSPIAPHRPLVAIELEPGLRAWRCEDSGGCFLVEADYWKWLARQPGRNPPPDTAAAVEEDAEQPARLCPVTGRLMIRCRVGHGLRFSIDRSPAGFWLDAGEWDALRARRLGAELHHVFTASWQHGIRHAEARQALRDGLAKRLGAADFAEAGRVRGWLARHPRRSEILAWLMADDGA